MLVSQPPNYKISAATKNPVVLLFMVLFLGQNVQYISKYMSYSQLIFGPSTNAVCLPLNTVRIGHPRNHCCAL
jgi:hypothetical protein